MGGLVSTADLPDYTRSTAINVAIPEETALPVRPFGNLKDKGAIETGAAYATVATRTITNGKNYALAKIVISAEKAAYFKYRWNSTDISSERLMDDKTIVIEHFPWGYHEMLGDGAKAFDVQAKYDSEVGTISVEIVGEEYTA